MLFTCSTDFTASPSCHPLYSPLGPLSLALGPSLAPLPGVPWACQSGPLGREPSSDTSLATRTSSIAPAALLAPSAPSEVASLCGEDWSLRVTAGVCTVAREGTPGGTRLRGCLRCTTCWHTQSGPCLPGTGGCTVHCSRTNLGHPGYPSQPLASPRQTPQSALPGTASGVALVYQELRPERPQSGLLRASRGTQVVYQAVPCCLVLVPCT